MTSLVIEISQITLIIVLMFLPPTLLSTTNAYNIRDYKGKKVINGGNYYITSIIPAPEDADNTISMAYNISNIPNCPLFAAQTSDSYTPAIISSYQNSKYIDIGANVNISYRDNLITCNNISQLTWSAMQAADNNNLIYVVAANQYPTFHFGNFRVVDSGLNQKNVYKFVYCTDDLGCLDVGLLTNIFESLLAITTQPGLGDIQPFYFRFV